MGRIATLARRTFIVGVGAVAAGLAVGTYFYKRDPKNPLLDELPDGATAFNPYVRIDKDGITLITPRADIGQGAYSVQAALIAEELDLAWGQFSVDHGPPSAAYYNGVVAAEAMPIAATSESFFARMGRGAGDVVGKLVGMQITGGSSTVPDAFDKLRVAGAVARQMLLQAAAQQTGVPIAQLKTQDSHVITPDGKRLSYLSLAAAAGKQSPPSSVTLKPEAQWRLLGKPMKRIDIEAKSTGRAMFGIDLRLPDMVYATVKTNPRIGGGVKKLDTQKAQAAKGVLKVVPIAGGFGVIANNTWRAFEAAKLVDVEWGPAPYPLTSAAMFDEVAKSFTEQRKDSRFKNDGDVDVAVNAAVKAAGDKVVQAEYRVPYLAHAPLEPMNAVVQLKDGRLDIWTGTQIPRFVQAAGAKVAGIDEDKVHVHVLISGGSFGRRLEDDYVRQAVELAKAHQGVPIKMTWTREEDMTHDFPRPLAMARGRGTVANGHVQAFDLAIAAPSVNASQVARLGFPAAGPDVAIVVGAWDQPFAIPHLRVTGHRVPELAPISSWRSVGASINGFMHESFFDELIRAAGADPLAERLHLCNHEPSRRVLQTVGDLSGWSKPLATSPDGKRGRGLAFTLSFGVPTAEVVEVTATARGIRVDKVYIVAEVGKVLDPVNFDAQMQGGVIWGLGHAMFAEITYDDGIAQQTNFHQYPSLRLNQTPVIVVKALENGPIKGIGEPPVPPAAPALANAIFDATGKRVRELPMSKSVEFV